MALKSFAVAMTACLTVMLMSGCQATPPVATQTEKALCDVLRTALPTFSDEDTPETQVGVARLHDLFTDPELCGS